MGLLSDLVVQGKVRNREDLRRVYRRLVKKLHPDSAPVAMDAREGQMPGDPGRTRGFIDFSDLRRELGEAERLLAELDEAARERAAPETAPGEADGVKPGQGDADHSGAKGKAEGRQATVVTRPKKAFDGALLANELRDLVARGFPVQPRALARNKAYRDCVAKVSEQLSLLTGDPRAFASADADMRVVRNSSLSLIYHVMQVLWNGLDWRLAGMAWSRAAALRDYAFIEGELAEKGLSALGALLSWIVDSRSPADFGDRAGKSRR